MASKQYCILFYKYHPLTDNPQVLETYRQATEVLCKSLNLTGRILIGLSNNGEGINGTLAGTKDGLNAYVDCMLGRDITALKKRNVIDIDDQRRNDAVVTFREASKMFFARLNVPQLFLESPNDFKWSSWSGGDEGDELSGVCPGGKRDTTTASLSNSSDGAVNKDGKWFPDLHIKIVKEIISSGGAFADISTKDTSVGYLTPQQWHEEIQALVEKKKHGDNTKVTDGEEEVETVLIDVRNHKECQIGSFAPSISIDPQTKTFAQFPKWVKDNTCSSEASTAESSSSLLNNKRILMYCTGGIRCEKASAYIRQVASQHKGVYHLKGGIHKYLEEFGDGDQKAHDGKEDGSNGAGKECLFVGKNFVFDRRGALDAHGHGADIKTSCTSNAQERGVIGKCQYCSDSFDSFHPENICTVCREPILICEKCKSNLSQQHQYLRGLVAESNNGGNNSCRTEYHCEGHFHLKECYFTSLNGFSVAELQKQLELLRSHNKELEGIGKKGKQKRRTLKKQMEKLEACIKQLLARNDSNGMLQQVEPASCRHCGSFTCASDCWGFHGGNKRMVNKNVSAAGGDNANNNGQVEPKKDKQRSRLPSNQRPAKRAKRENDISEIEVLQLYNKPSYHRNNNTSLRVPPPVVRVLRSGVKGRWCGKTIGWVLRNEFGECLSGLPQEGRDERLEDLIKEGLIRRNGVPVKSSDVLLRNMDTIERIIHWHEPPISIPSKISLTTHALPKGVLPSIEDGSTEKPLIYCINKPASVPIYPSGPYYANSLMLMVEAQEGLPPKTLIPLHRIDRATSGVLLCANTSSVARVMQGRMSNNCKDDDNDRDSPVKKLYLSRVKGKFPSTSSENPTIPQDCASITSIGWRGDDDSIIEVNAPIAVDLEANGNKDGGLSNAMMHRSVRSDGKESVSRFKLISYDKVTDQSLVACAPITGRGHQLRVHFQLIGYPIHNDVEYGGMANSDDMQERKMISAQAMLDITTATSNVLHEENVTTKEVKSAIKLCKCCNCNGGLEGIESAFNSAQLLGCGHAIDLHAYKYHVSFKHEESKANGGNGKMTSIDFSTDLPSWAVDLKQSNEITWLG